MKRLKRPGDYKHIKESKFNDDYEMLEVLFEECFQNKNIEISFTFRDNKTKSMMLENDFDKFNYHDVSNNNLYIGLENGKINIEYDLYKYHQATIIPSRKIVNIIISLTIGTLSISLKSNKPFNEVDL